MILVGISGAALLKGIHPGEQSHRDLIRGRIQSLLVVLSHQNFDG
jgi:hypothetical protein